MYKPSGAVLHRENGKGKRMEGKEKGIRESDSMAGPVVAQEAVGASAFVKTLGGQARTGESQHKTLGGSASRVG